MITVENKDLKKKIMEDEDFIHCPRLGNSLQKLIDKNPEGVTDERIAKVLLMDEEEVKTIFIQAIEKIRSKIGL
jgi:hypothetical protein